MGQILRIDLSQEKSEIQSLPQELFRQYIGADGLASKVMYDELPLGVSPLGPENIIVISAGPLAGTKVQSSCTLSITAKSPSTGFTMYASHCNGTFARMLKFAGYDAIVVKGQSARPVYLLVTGNGVEIRDAAAAWGKNTDDTEDRLKKEVNLPGASCLCIGPAGENLAQQAAVVTDKTHVAARGGIGAVLGSKKLKGIVCFGQRPVPIDNIQKLDECSKKWRELNTSLAWPQKLSKYGSAALVDMAYPIGDLPIKNWTHGILDGWEKLRGQNIIENMAMLKRHTTCPSCTLAHTKELVLKGNTYEGQECKHPEFEMLVAMGSNLGITEPDQVCKGAEYLDKLGLDGLATSNAIALTMECFEKGLISSERLGGLRPTWGNHSAAMELSRQIAFREGFGEILADGSLRAAEYIGQGAEDFVVQVQGMPLPMHDHRSCWGYALQYAVGSAGPAHEGGPLFAEMQGVVPRMSVDGKAKLVKNGQEAKIFLNTLGCCSYGSIGVSLDLMVETVNAVTGLGITVQEAMKIGRRIINLRRAFNLRNGLTPADDTLPVRYTNDPPPDGGSKGSRINIKPMVRDYYKLMGWDEKTGKPYRSTLEQLDLADVASDLWG